MCFKGPKDIIGMLGFGVSGFDIQHHPAPPAPVPLPSSQSLSLGTYGFEVEEIGGIQTQMCGSPETHKAYVYRSVTPGRPTKPTSRRTRSAKKDTVSHPDWPGSAIDLNVHANLAYLTEEGRSALTGLLHTIRNEWLEPKSRDHLNRLVKKIVS